MRQRTSSAVNPRPGPNAILVLPPFIPPMVATTVPELPEDDGWLYELKLDGYRALVLKGGSRVQIRSRNNKDLTAAYRTIATAASRLRADSLVLDGEVVAVD